MRLSVSFAVLSLLLWASACAPSRALSSAPKKGEQQDPDVDVRLVESKRGGIKIDVPHFRSLPPSVNAILRRLALAPRREHLASFAEVKRNRPDFAKHLYLVGSFQVFARTKHMLSVRLYHEAYQGGAHGWHVYRSVNLRPDTGEFLPLVQIFRPGFDILGLARGICASAMAKARGQSRQGFVQLMVKNPTAFRNWNLSAEGLEFVFNEYELAQPYAVGPFFCKIPADKLKGKLREPFAL